MASMLRALFGATAVALALLGGAAAQGLSPEPLPAPASSPPLDTASGGAGGTAPIKGWNSISTISAASVGPCAVYALENNAAMCWGRQLGYGDQLANFSAPTRVASGASWRQLTSGHYVNSSTGAQDAFNCGIDATGGGYCWGSDFSGLGLLGAAAPATLDWFSRRYSLEPLPLAEPGPWNLISSGDGFSCAVKSEDSSAWCWGTNEYASLGCGVLAEQMPYTAAPCRVNSTETWLRVVAGFSMACGIGRNGLWCWGNLGTVAGNGTAEPQNPPQSLYYAVPQQVLEANVTQVAIGATPDDDLTATDTVCIVMADKTASCFTNSAWPPTLVPVPGDHKWSSIAVGRDHKCGITNDEQVLCWGRNLYGQCGTGRVNLAPLTEPTLILTSVVNGPASFGQVETGDRFTCVRSTIGEIYCFGGYVAATGPTKDMTFGELGIGNFKSSAVPLRILDPSSAPPSPPPSPLSPPPPSPPPPSPPPVPVEDSSSTPVGAIVGGVVGGIAAVAAALGALLYCRKRRAAAPGTVPKEPSSGPGSAKLESDLPGAGAGGGSALQQKAAAVLADVSDGSPTVIPAAWSSDFVRSDQLLSWISTHVVPAGTASGGGLSSLTGSGAGTGSHTGSGTGGGASTASASGTVLPAPAAVGPAMFHQTSTSSRSSVRSPKIVDIQPWEVNFLDLRMERVIGKGSFGKVYLASLHETPVAVKILLKMEDSAGGKEEPATLSSPALAGLYKETELLCAMRHPNVVQLMGFCTYPPAIITEFCSRGSLTDVLQAAWIDPQMAAQLTWARRLHMAVDAARGMFALHQHSPPIIHRDLKGPNLLVEATWRVKVTDFNLSKVMEHDGSMQSTGSPVNPRWLAPEILKGARASVASDVFSYGVVLWELLTWQVPWAGVDFWEIVSSLMKGERLPVPPRDHLPGPDTQRFAGLDAYCALMQRCWAQAPEERPDFNEVIRCLRPLAAGAP